MSDLAWTAEGIRQAEEAGGVTLERYRRPGFSAPTAVRRVEVGGAGSGFEIAEGDELPPWLGVRRP